MLRVAILQSFCSLSKDKIFQSVKRNGMQPEAFLLHNSPEKLKDYAGYIILSESTSYTQAGLLAALSPLIQVLKSQSKQGKPILGIGYGAQILVETGLVPGLANDAVGVGWVDNKPASPQIPLRLTDHYQLNAFTKHLKPHDILLSEGADRPGNFVIPQALLLEMQYLGMNVFQYCDMSGKDLETLPAIAAISNKVGNVMAMIPQLEETPKSDLIFRSMREYMQEGYVQQVLPLNYFPRLPDIQA